MLALALVAAMLVSGARADAAGAGNPGLDIGRLTVGLGNLGLPTYDCSQHTDCSDCIKMYTFGCGWCADLSNGLEAGHCFRADDETTYKEECPNGFVTYHDPHLFGDECCYQYSGNCTECLSGHGYCEYCGNYQVNNTPMTLCYHAKNHDEISAQCAQPIDKTACCSEFSEDCRSCLAGSVCSFCYKTKECLYTSTGMNIPDNWCIDDETGQSAIVEHCCEGNTCEECYANVKEDDHTWNPNSPGCIWCADTSSIELTTDSKTGDVSLTSKGKCVPPLEMACPSEDTNEKGQKVTQQMVLLGSGYCQDSCYMGSLDCKECTHHKAMDGSSCIWADNIDYTSVDDPNLIPMASEFCVPGSMTGPAQDYLSFPDFEASSTMDYTADFYFGTCSITGDVLLTIIIVAAAVIVVATITTIIVVSKVRQHKLKELVKKAEKQADQQIGEMIDIRDPNALFKLWQEEVPWEDEFEKSDDEAQMPVNDGSKRAKHKSSRADRSDSTDSIVERFGTNSDE